MKLKDNPQLPSQENPGVSRRGFLIGSASTALVMGFGAYLPAGKVQAAVEKRLFSPTVWFEVNEYGTVKINIAKAEMGQHVGTALARVVADELEAEWNQVTIEHVDTDPKWGYMVTGGSWSVFTTFQQLSQAGAAGRIALIEAGAQLLGKPVAECYARNSRVICGDASVSYADIVKAGNIGRSFSEDDLKALPLKPASERRLIGKPTDALDIPEKTRGTAQYGIDMMLPDMVYARPLIPPTRYGSKVVSVDDSKAKSIAGYQRYVTLSDPSDTCQGWVAVVADSYWAAVQAADAVTVEWQAGPTAKVSEADILEKGKALARAKDTGSLFVDEGDVSAAQASASKTLEATYTTATALHFHLEPVNAVVAQRGDHWHVYAGNQWQSLILPVVAKALGVGEDKITIHQYYLGGGFGRRLYGDYMVPAALTAKAIGQPVKMVFTREDDSRFDCVRSPSVAHFTASMDANNQVTGIEHAAAAGWPTLTMAPGFLGEGKAGGKVDGFAINGADHWYTLPNHRVRAINNELAQDTFLPGWLRAVGPGWIGFGVESFMDEVAHANGQDPVDMRLAMLDGSGRNAGKAPEAVGGAKRLHNVLTRLKAKSGWGRSLPKDEGLGVAVAHGQERSMPTWVGCAAHVKVDRATGKVTAKKLYVVVDCGTVVHPGGALAQVEGSTLWGVSLALHEGSRIENGQVADTNLDSYSPLRMADMPELDIEFVESTEMPVGLGEPAMIVVGPALANAVHAAVGVRVRHLPIKPDAILTGL